MSEQQIPVRCAEALAEIKDLRSDVSDIKETMIRIDESVRGNGKPGLEVRVGRLETGRANRKSEFRFWLTTIIAIVAIIATSLFAAGCQTDTQRLAQGARYINEKAVSIERAAEKGKEAANPRPFFQTIGDDARDIQWASGEMVEGLAGVTDKVPMWQTLALYGLIALLALIVLYVAWRLGVFALAGGVVRKLAAQLEAEGNEDAAKAVRQKTPEAKQAQKGVT